MKRTNRVHLLMDIAWVKLSDRCKMHKLCLMHKIKLAPSYLCNLCPAFVNESSCYSLRSEKDLCLPYVWTERHRKYFLFFSTTQLWNSLLSEVRLSSSLSSFKNNVSKYMKFPTHNYLFYRGDCAASIFHPHLRLNGVPGIDFQININLFHSVQSFISQSNHFDS